MKKVMLILIDGMRPDAFTSCGHPFCKKLMETCSYSMQMQSVMPSVTLPCHMSLFHSVDPQRHGIITNTYVPQVRPVNGLCEVLHNHSLKSSFFYSWEPLRDLSRPLSLARADFVCGRDFTFAVADKMVTRRVVEAVENDELTDFTFFYLCWADEAGHKYGWMTEGYMQAVYDCLDCAQHVVEKLPDNVELILTADHGGHDRSHGTEAPEDMNIPVFFRTKAAAPGELDEKISIIDIAPTISNLLNVPGDPDWEGRNIFGA